ncbi:Paired amphipathic helix protein Sin3-like 4 [Linum grandiflorum]
MAKFLSRNHMAGWMLHFCYKRKDYVGLLAKVKELFKGHPHLILWFATLRPKEVDIADIVPLEDEQSPWRKKPVDFEKAFGFLHKVKTRFQGADHHVFKAFFDILNSRRVENKSNIEVYDEVATLFEGHRDLVREFAEYAY